MSLYHFLQHNCPVFSFSSNTTYFLQKQPIKVQISRLSAAWVKVHQIPHVIFKQKVSFSSKFRSLFSVMRDKFSVLFQLKLHMLLTKVANQSANFQICHATAHIKIHQIPHIVFGIKSQFFFKLCITLQCHET